MGGGGDERDLRSWLGLPPCCYRFEACIQERDCGKEKLLTRSCSAREEARAMCCNDTIRICRKGRRALCQAVNRPGSCGSQRAPPAEVSYQRPPPIIPKLRIPTSDTIASNSAGLPFLGKVDVECVYLSCVSYLV